VAARYDAVWTSTAIGRAQRGQVWRQVDELFGAGDSMLDVGCGTGEDAAHFAARGVTVHATDASAAMVREAARRGGFSTAVMRAEEIAETPASGRAGETACARTATPYDGVLANFGALNCVEDLAAVAGGLATVVRPGGHAAIGVIGRFCLWETLYYGARLEWRKALRRVRHRSQMSSMGVRVHYRTVAELRAAFAPQFGCERWVGIGLLVPPSYVGLPDWLVDWCAGLDRILAGLPVLRGLADHRLLILVRK
jgi:SAM-dependent methyltransferase